MATAQAKYVIKLEDKTKKAFKAIGRSLKRTSSAVFNLKTGMVSAAGIAGIGYFVKKSLDATDEMAKMSRAIGVSVEELQRLRHAASLGGLEATQLDKAVQKLAVNMADMSKGVGLAKDVFQKYDISVMNADGTLRDVVDVMADVADVTANMTNNTEKADLAYKLFGARGGKMINVLEGGSQAMREAMMEADKLGLVMSAETAKGVENANDAMTRLSAFLTLTFTQAVAKLAPAIKTVTDSIRQWVEMKVTEAGGIGNIARDMAEAIVMSAVSILKAFDDMGNGMINWINTIRASLPIALGGFRPIKEIKQDIAELEAEFQKASLVDGIFTDHVGELGALYTELENASGAQIKAKFSTEAMRKQLLATLPAIHRTTEAYEDLGDTDPEPKPKKEKTIWDKMKDGFASYKSSVEKGSLSIASITKGAMKSTEDAIVNMIMGVKTDFRAMANSIAADLVRMQVQRTITKPLDKFIGEADWGELLSFNGGGFTGAGARAGGVDGRGGFPAILHPNETVVDHTKGNTGQVINVTYSPQVNALDPRTAQMVIAENAQTIVGVVRQAFNRNGKAVAL